MSPEEARSSLRSLFRTAIDAVDPAKLIQRAVQRNAHQLRVRLKQQEFFLPLPEQAFIIGAGKGAGLLAQGLETLLAERISGGVVVLPHGQRVALDRVGTVYGEHPLPGPGSLAAAEQLALALQKRKETDLVCFCLTGGASSLLVSPTPGLTLHDKLAVNKMLLACGADISEVNTVRKHLSQVKGGGLARWVFPSSLVSFILSDVVGDDLSTIGSGPTVPDSTTFNDAWRVLERFNLLDDIPCAVQQHLRRGVEGSQQETPKPGDPIFTNVTNILIGSNRLALEATAEAASSVGFLPQIQEAPLRGDTTEAALRFAEAIKTQRGKITQPTCFLAGGETTVQVTGTGKGGRNQEFALVVAQALANESGWTLLSAGTDGIDGPTDAAGAFVDGRTINKAERHGLNARQVLDNHDSYHFFAALGDLFSPGPTGTNVMDIKIVLLYP
jgi:hydroxypyruvate reductase